MATASAPSTARVPSTKRASLQAKHILFAVLGLMTLFVLYQRELQLLDPNSFLRQRYAQLPWWMAAHGVFGALALILGVFQFSTRLRQRHLQLHRIMGRIYIGSAVIAGPSAVFVSYLLGPPMLLMASVVQASGWLITALTALYCVRTGRIQQHREWMIRSYPFAMVFVVVRVIIAIPAVAHLGLVGLVSTVWSVIATACFLPSFIIAWSHIGRSTQVAGAR